MEDVNELRPYDDKKEYGDLSLLHRLVIGPYTCQLALLLSLMTFSDADIDQTTSNGHTAFQLAVVVGSTFVYTVMFCASAMNIRAKGSFELQSSR